jgi:malate synthase
MQSHREARLWNDVFTFSEERLGIPAGSIRATVLIETLPAAFEMDEILYELRDHSGGLNAGRWDYIFSAIKSRRTEDFVLPDRTEVTMTVPFMSAYSELLVATCHKRGAFAMGGMSAFLPSRTDEEVNRASMQKVGEDKQREAEAGFDGTWVAHPDFVRPALEQFDRVLGDRPEPDREAARRRERERRGPARGARDAGRDHREGPAAERQHRHPVPVGWLRGNGAAAIYGLMEDAATAEISRSQIWQWLRNGATLSDTGGADHARPRAPPGGRGARADPRGDRRRRVVRARGPPKLAKRLFEQMAIADELADFLTLPAYEAVLKIEAGEEP